MDSLTQIVLGAAVGELTQGKKLGNRAMIWGAIAGTIPDLDVFIGKLFTDPVDDLAFHRGITHSFFFAFVFSWVMAALTVWIYDRGNYKKLSFAYSFVGVIAAVVLSILIYNKANTISLAGSALLVVPTTIYAIYRWRKRKRGDHFESIHLGLFGWYKLFFWSIITHPILDCFTTYGTQILLPFSDKRVSFNNISVADPGYTLPFLICLIIASIYTRKSRYRRLFNNLGLILSSLYMIWTFYNKNRVNTVVEKTLAEKNIDYQRYMTTPTILNNILWSSTIECDSVYYQGLYSFYDEEKKIDLIKIPKNRHLLLNANKEDHTINTLKWFSNDYYGLITRKDGRMQMNDLRYGTFSGEAMDEDDYIFKFILEKNAEGDYKLKNTAGKPPEDKSGKKAASRLWNRMMGRK